MSWIHDIHSRWNSPLVSFSDAVSFVHPCRWLDKRSEHVNQVLTVEGAICGAWIIQVSAASSMVMKRWVVFSMIISKVVITALQLINKLVLCLLAFESVEVHVHWFSGFGRDVFDDEAIHGWVFSGYNSFGLSMPHFSKCYLEGHGLFVDVKKCSQFCFSCQTNRVFDNDGQSEDGTIFEGIFVVGQKVMSTHSALSTKFG